MILDLDLAGRKRKVVLHPNKSGFAYILDRETGKYLRSFPYGSPNWAKGIDENGRPIDPLVPSDHKDFVMCPGLGPGARGIQHSAYSPRTGWWYTTDLEICSTLKGGEGAGAPILNPNNPPVGVQNKILQSVLAADDGGRFSFRRRSGRKRVCAGRENRRKIVVV